MRNIVNEIMDSVNESGTALEDCRLVNGGKIYHTKVVDGLWKCVFLGVNFDVFERDAICEVFEDGVSLEVFIHQKQEKKIYLGGEPNKKFKYGVCTCVKKSTERPVCTGWVEEY